MKILLFGQLADAVGQPSIEMGAETDTDNLKKKIFARYPELEKYSFRVAVNRKVYTENVRVTEEDVVAFLPPFSGG